MSRLRIWCFFLLIGILGATCHSKAQSLTLLLRQVTVIDATGAPARKDVDVLIRGGRIDKIAITRVRSFNVGLRL